MTLIKEKRWDCVANKVERKWNEDIFNDKKKKVCWAYYLADDYIGEGKGIGFVWANRCDGDPEKDDYYCKFADECHAELGTGPGKNWDENIIDPDTTAEMFKDCYAIIYSSYYRNLADEVEGEDEARKQRRGKALEVLKTTPAWQKGNVYDLTKSGPSNWYESRIVHYGEKIHAICVLYRFCGILLVFVGISRRHIEDLTILFPLFSLSHTLHTLSLSLSLTLTHSLTHSLRSCA